MKIIYTVLLVSFCSFILAQTGSPALPYYSGFNFNQSGSTLKNDLSTKVIAMHTVFLSYQDAENAIKLIDRDPSDLSGLNLLLIYGFSENMCPDNTTDFQDHRRRNRFDDGTAFCQWNREHTYPKSLGIPDLGTDGPGADVHHLRASDVNRNALRGNTKFGPGSGVSGFSNSFWYPGDEWKGDIARMMMYMYLRYGDQCLPKNVGAGNILTTDNNMIDLFLQWNAEDPVSEIEDRRNTYLGNTSNFYAQGNRNPFIDNPYLATLIWGGVPAENRWPSVLSNPNFDMFSSMTIYPNPTQNNQVTITATDMIIDAIQVLNTSGQVIQEINYPTTTNNTYPVNIGTKGFYLVRIKSNSQTTTRKVIVD